MTLHLYFARRFLITFLSVFAIFLGILVLIDLVEQVRRFDGSKVGFWVVLGLTFLKAPESLYRILPLVMILATLSLFLSLARTSELVVARASGRSALRSLNAPLVVAVLIGIAAVTILNPMVAATSQQYEVAAERLSTGQRSALSLSAEGLWLRQNNGSGQTVIRAERANLDGTALYGVTFLTFAANAGPVARVEAESARLSSGEWVLQAAKEWYFDAPNPEQSARLHDTLTLPSTLTPGEILDSFSTPSAIPIWDLPEFIDRLERAGFSARKHRVWLHMELAQPLLLAAMVLVGAGFTMRHTRFGR
ncbi:hypothetical protein LCGC14_3013870, partial [marine sediment metagenome]